MSLQEKIQKKAEGFGRLAPAFLEGAEFALNNQYISVEDDLPCFHKELFDGAETKHVVTLDSNGDIHLDYMIYYFTKKEKWEWNRKDANILFWFPIPEPPKTNE